MQSTYYHYRTVYSYRCSTRSYRTCHTRFCPPWRCCGPQSGHHWHYTPSTATTTRDSGRRQDDDGRSRRFAAARKGVLSCPQAARATRTS